MNWRRLWQPRRGLFWVMVVLNVLSSVCAWALREWPLNTGGQLLLTIIGLLNVAFGLLAAWHLLRDEPPAAR